eukprot:g17292.t1
MRLYLRSLPTFEDRLRPSDAEALLSFLTASILASLELLPELYHHARGLSPAELRLVLAAYSGHSQHMTNLKVWPSDQTKEPLLLTYAS